MASLNDSVSDFLANEDKKLEDRLKTASSVFTSGDLYSVNSKNAVLEWIKQTLVNDALSHQNRKLIYEMLKECISNISETSVRPQLTQPIIEILVNMEETNTNVLKCFMALFQNTHFIKYFVLHGRQFADVVINFVDKIKRADVDEILKRSGYRIIVHTISRVNNGSLHDNTMKLLFVERLMVPVTIMYKELISTASEFDYCSIEILIYEVLFRSTTFRAAFTRNLFVSSPAGDSEVDQIAFKIIEKIQEYPTYQIPTFLADTYSLLLSGFIYNFPSHSEGDTFKFYVALNSFMYVRPLAIDDNHEKCVLLQNNTVAVSALAELICLRNLPLQSQWKFTLSSWLSSLIEFVLQKLEGGLTDNLLILLKHLLCTSPTVIEENLKKLIKSIMLKKKSGPDVIKAYTNLCRNICETHVRLFRLHKLISNLLITIKENVLNFNLENMPDKFDVFPEEVFEYIQNVITLLPSTVQNVALLNTLLFHLENDCVALLESDSSKDIDTRWFLSYDIVTTLISSFIRGTRVVDHSVPDVVKAKFVSLMESLAGLLGRFGKAIISKKHVPQLCGCFLHICLVWGDMQILFMIYETRPRKVPKQVGMVATAPTNLVYLHPYLSDFHWKIIAQRVVNFGDDHCVNLLNDLVLQKIHAIPYLEDELQGPYVENVYDDGPSVVCAQYLINRANPKWLFAHVSDFLHLLKPTDVLMLARSLIGYCQQCEEREINTIFSADFRESRLLVVAMSCYTFHSLSKKFASYHLKEMKRMLRRIDYEEMLKAEDQDAEAVDAVQEVLHKVSSLLSTDFVYANAELPGDSFKTDLLLLNKLPLRYLRRENKSLICLLTLSLMKNLVKLNFVTCNADEILLQSCKVLQGILTDIDLPSTVDCGKLMAWFYHGLKNTPYCDSVMRGICQATKRYGCGVDSVLEIIKAVDDDNRTDVFIESKLEGVDLLTSYLGNFEKIQKQKHEKSKIMEKLKTLCYKYFDEIFDSSCENNERKDKQLALFTLLLQEALQTSDEEHLRHLTEQLPHYMRVIDQYDLTKWDVFCKFLVVLLKHHRELREHLPQNFFIDAWCELYHLLDNDVISVFLRVASVDDYLEILETLFADTEGCLPEPVDENFDILERIWKVVIDTPVKEVKVLIKRKFVPRMCILAQEYVVTSFTPATPVTIRLFLKIFTSFLQNKSIVLNYELIDVCFTLITSIAFDSRGEVALLADCVELLFLFCAVRPKLLLDRIPSFYVCYRSLYSNLVRNCDADKAYDSEMMTSAAHKMEKLTDSLVKYKQMFKKTAISAIADCISVMSTINTPQIVKGHLKNIIYCWISLCDLHGVGHLSSTLPSASATLFKQYYADYNKHFKFSGKV